MFFCTLFFNSMYNFEDQMYKISWNDVICTCTIFVRKKLYMHNFRPKNVVHVQFLISIHCIFCTCTLSPSCTFSDVQKRCTIFEVRCRSKCTVFSLRCTTRCTDIIFENGDRIRALNAITLEDARKNRPRRAIFALTGAHWLKLH